MNANEASDVRELTAGELDEVNGGMAWFGAFVVVCGIIGLAAEIVIGGSDTGFGGGGGGYGGSDLPAGYVPPLGT